MAGDVHLHSIPNWVWVFFIVAIFVFGFLYLVPEARQYLGSLFTHEETMSLPASPKAPARPKRTTHSEPDDTKVREFGSEEEASEVCPGRVKTVLSGQLFWFECRP
jgi:hypothetical protein